MSDTERHIANLDKIVRGMGSMAMEYWDIKDEERAREALDLLASMARHHEYCRSYLNAEPGETLLDAIQRVATP